MECATVAELFGKAVAPDEAPQLDFAKRIPDILLAFPKTWVEEHFITFLASWLPKNNAQIVSAVVDSFAQIVASVNQLETAAPLVEAILSSDDHEIAARVAKVLKDVQNPSGTGLLKVLCASKHDCVRQFVSKMLTIAVSDDDRRAILRTLVYDESFKVRLSTARAIPELPESIGVQIALTLQTDRNGRIRAMLPAICARETYYLCSVAPELVKDHDWAVKMAVAASLMKCRKAEEAFRLAAHLLQDGVWQVKLCALRSMTALLPRMQGNEIPDRANLEHELSEAIDRPYVRLKNAVTDCFMAMFQRTPNLRSEWVASYAGNVMSKQPAHVKLHFLERIVKDRAVGLLNCIRGQLLEIVLSLTRSEVWRLRLGIVELFYELEQTEPSIKDRIFEESLRMLNDEAAPVRAAAAKQLADMTGAIRVNGSFPQYLIDLCGSDTYRKRQAAVMVMSFLHAAATDGSDKQALMAEMQRLLQDPCPNVVAFAQGALGSLSAELA